MTMTYGMGWGMGPTAAEFLAIHRHLDEHPGDWGARLVLADMLLDHGDVIGEGAQRWMAKWRKCPSLHPGSENKLWTWWGYSIFTRVDVAHWLPDALYRPGLGTFDWHATRRGAEDALARALEDAGHPDP